MKAIYILTVLAGLGGSVVAQGLSSVDGALTIKGGTVSVKGDLRLDGGSFANDGSLFISGNLINNQAMAESDTGALTFNGNVTQTVGGTQPYFTRYLNINNTGFVALENSIKVGGAVNFVNGIVNAGLGFPLVIGNDASVAGVSDMGHVDGNVVKLGTGVFTYPVGDGFK